MLGTSNYELSPSHESSNGRTLRQIALCRSAHRREGSNTPHARKIWRAAKPAEGTPAQTYLQHRGITIEPPTTIRYHPGLKHGPTGLQLPAMVAAVTMWPGREVVAIHRTFITADGSKKALVTQNKMMLGPCRGGAVRLDALGDALMVGEGIGILVLKRLDDLIFQAVAFFFELADLLRQGDESFKRFGCVEGAEGCHLSRVERW